MTRDQAAEALYRAAKNVGMNWRAGVPEGLDALGIAITTYEDATPSPLPAEVARVLEAADAYVDKDTHETWHELAAASRAYRRRSSQPEPLSARLARLGKGARVRAKGGSTGTVEANSPQRERLWLVVDGNERYPMATYRYGKVTAILSEVS